MKKFIIPVVWTMYGKYEIEATSLEEAISKAENMPLPDGEYLQDSFSIDYEGIPEKQLFVGRPELP